MEFRRRAAKRVQPARGAGAAREHRCGVTTLGDIAQPGWPVADVAASPLRVTVFQELIAPTAERVRRCDEVGPIASPQRGDCRHSRRRLGKLAARVESARAYSVHPDLLAAVVALSAAEHVPVAMHLAESREELELLRHGTGPLRAFLEDLGAWDAGDDSGRVRGRWTICGCLASAHRTLVIHGNYLDDEEIGFLGANAERMTAVYCPRTHDWFAHDAYPLEKMLAAGVAVALGTDGRGSSPDLSLLAELRFAARRHPAVGLDRILQMGTHSRREGLGVAITSRLAGAGQTGRPGDRGPAQPRRGRSARVALRFGGTGGGLLLSRNGIRRVQSR